MRKTPFVEVVVEVPWSNFKRDGPMHIQNNGQKHGERKPYTESAVMQSENGLKKLCDRNEKIAQQQCRIGP